MKQDMPDHRVAKDGKTVYAFILKWPEAPVGACRVRLESVRAQSGSPVTMLGLDHEFKYTQDDRALTIDVPEWFADPAKRPGRFACAFKIRNAAGRDVVSPHRER